MPDRWVKWWGLEDDHPLLQRFGARGGYLWMTLIHRANYANGSQLQRGQLATSTRRLAKQTHIGHMSVHRMLHYLEDEGMITRQPLQVAGQPCSLITVCNYETYQAMPDDLGTPPVTGLSRGESGGVTGGERISKKKKKNQKNYIHQFEAWWESYPKKSDKPAAARAWAARMREGVSVESLTMARDAYAQLRRGQDPRYTMHGSRFLGGRWQEFMKAPGQVITMRKCRDCGGQFAEEELMELDTGWLCHGCGAGYSDYHELVRRDADKRRLQAEQGQGGEAVDLFGVEFRGGDEEGP